MIHKKAADSNRSSVQVCNGLRPPDLTNRSLKKNQFEALRPSLVFEHDSKIRAAPTDIYFNHAPFERDHVTDVGSEILKRDDTRRVVSTTGLFRLLRRKCDNIGAAA